MEVRQTQIFLCGVCALRSIKFNGLRVPLWEASRKGTEAEITLLLRCFSLFRNRVQNGVILANNYVSDGYTQLSVVPKA